MMEKRVIIVYPFGFRPFEGWYRRTFNQARALAEDGYTVTVVAWDRSCTKPAEDVAVGGFRVHRVYRAAGISQGPSNALNHLRFNRDVYAYVMQHPCDVVQGVGTAVLPVALWTARRRRCRAVSDICEPDNFKGFWSARYNLLIRAIDRLEKSLAKRYDFCFVHNANQLARFQSAGVTRIARIGSYPDATLLRAEPRRWLGRRVVVGRLGSVYAGNGYEEVVSAFRQLMDRRAAAHDRTEYRLRIAGKVFDNYAETFQRLIAPLGDRVEITGAYDVAQLAELYETIDISLLLYGKGAFHNVTPTKLFESMACGVPVVVSQTGGMADIVEEAGCGVVVDGSDPAAICEGIERIAASPERMAVMSANAIKAARERYTWESVRPEFLARYRSLFA